MRGRKVFLTETCGNVLHKVISDISICTNSFLALPIPDVGNYIFSPSFSYPSLY